MLKNKLSTLYLFMLVFLAPQLRAQVILPSTCEVIKYELNIDIFGCFKKPYPHSFAGIDKMTIKADTIIDKVDLNAETYSINIDSVAPAGFSFEYKWNVLTVKFDRYYYKDDTLSFTVYYHHKDVYDEAFYRGWNVVYTDCESRKARRWFPCIDDPSKKALFELTAKVPSDIKFGSNGYLADSITNGDTAYYRWVSAQPIATYLVAIAGSAKYNLDILNWNDNSRNVPIRFYYKPWENMDSLKNIKSDIIPMAEFYSRLFGDYPFDKIGFATADSLFPWGGMENQTLIVICPQCWQESLIAHEFAHHWFGDMISPKHWADIWLNEGFATYCEALWAEHTGGRSAYMDNIEQEAAMYLFYNPGTPIYSDSWIQNPPSDEMLFSSPISYSKAGCVLHMLRYVLGDTLFFRSLRNYATDPEFKYKSASTYDFERVVNTTAGKDYSWFFDEWLKAPNHPEYSNSFRITSMHNYDWDLMLTIRQTQKEQFFRMPIEIKVQFVDSPDSTIMINNDRNNQEFTFTFNKEPRSVVFDPNKNILLKYARMKKIE